MEIKRSITFDVEKRKKDGLLIVKNVPIRCMVTFNRNRITFFTGHRIDASKFVPEKGIVKNGCFNKAGESSSEINSDLDDIRATLQTYSANTRERARCLAPTISRKSSRLRQAG